MRKVSVLIDPGSPRGPNITDRCRLRGEVDEVLVYNSRRIRSGGLEIEHQTARGIVNSIRYTQITLAFEGNLWKYEGGGQETRR